MDIGKIHEAMEGNELITDRRRFILDTAAVFAAIALPGLSLHSRSVNAAPLQPVRLGYQFHLWGATAVVAVREGMFKAAGLTVQDRKFSSGAEARNGMVAGSIDVGTVGLTPFVIGATLGDLVAMGAVCYAGRSGLVMAKKGVKSIGELRGKKIASQVGSTLDNVFKKKIAPEAGLTEKDYQIVNSQFSDHVAALASGSVDAFLGLEPFCSIAEAKGIAVPLTDYFKYDIIPNMLAVSSKFADKYPDTCVAFMRAWLSASDLFAKNPNHVADIMLRMYKESGYELEPAMVRRIVSRLIVNPDYIPELPASIEAEAASLKNAGKLDRIPDPKKILITEFLTKARQKS